MKPTVAAGKGIVGSANPTKFGDATNQQASGTPYE